MSLVYRISEQADVNDRINNGTADGKVDATDPVFFIATDLAGRRVATYLGRDDYPKERFAYHMSGTGAGGGGSAGAVGPILRTRDEDASKPTNWATQYGSTVHDERYYYNPDFRGNVSAIVSSGGNLIEQYRYSATGVPIGIARGDVNADGVVGTPGGGGGGTVAAFTATSNADYDQAVYLEENKIYEVRADWNLDGKINAIDTAVAAAAVGTATGRKVMSAVGVRNAKVAAYRETIAENISQIGSRMFNHKFSSSMTGTPILAAATLIPEQLCSGVMSIQPTITPVTPSPVTPGPLWDVPWWNVPLKPGPGLLTPSVVVPCVVVGCTFYCIGYGISDLLFPPIPPINLPPLPRPRPRPPVDLPGDDCFLDCIIMKLIDDGNCILAYEQGINDCSKIDDPYKQLECFADNLSGYEDCLFGSDLVYNGCLDDCVRKFLGGKAVNSAAKSTRSVKTISPIGVPSARGCTGRSRCTK
jgi:hypothetical protein